LLALTLLAVFEPQKFEVNTRLMLGVAGLSFSKQGLAPDVECDFVPA
jgi:hypothetical protein